MFQIALGRLSLFTAPFKFYARPRRVGKTSPESAYEIIPFHRNTATDSLAPTVTRGEEGCRSRKKQWTYVQLVPVPPQTSSSPFPCQPALCASWITMRPKLAVAFCSDDH